ncbi:bis-tetraphosphatase [Viridothelium virens]|uniref:Bis-tetraphosphatase n=1 Tax=Viridothelium virens TaxID=1048519 RepID=A0A6A6H4L3_VIRVR|nr:bis-tetraphosphatase [Viridothelium virens]
MLASLRGNLNGLVKAKYKAARAAQSLIFSSTELAIIETEASVPFQLRYCPALAKKPQKDASTEDVKDKSKKPDPFDNPDEALLIAQLPEENPSHLLVLNKYPVIPEHFILATKQNKQQTALLERDDLEAMHACLKGWEEASSNSEPKRLFAFFNSGDHSGASQPHRHVQFLPVEEMAGDCETGRWKMLIDIIEDQAPSQGMGYSDLISHPDLPFLHYGQRITPDIDATGLFELYTRLYRAAESAVRLYIEKNPGTLRLHPTEGESNPISYNLGLTTSFMAICPRRKEGETLLRSDGSEIGSVALNGTLLAGTLMVKNEEEWELLKSNKSKFDEILGAVGIPSNARDPKFEYNKI